MSFQHPHDVPQPYPLILRTRTFLGWQPIPGVLLLILSMFVLGPVLMLPVLAVAVAVDHEGSFGDAFEAALKLDPVSWQGLLYLNLALAFLVPATWFVVRFLHGLAPRWLSSVRPGFRWRFFWACFGLSVVAILASIIVSAFLPADPNDLEASLNDWTGRLTAIALVVAVTTPLQAMGEEYLFRGYLMQAIGSFWSWVCEACGVTVRNSRTVGVVTAIVLTSLLFALAHGVQNAPLFLDRFAFGLMAGYVVLRTGGLEAGIALHIWNNLFAFGLALAFGNIDDTLKVSEVGWSNILLTITMNGVYLLLVLRLGRRMGITALSNPPPGVPVLAPATPPV